MNAAPAPADWKHVTFISAGAGSGKTYRLTEELEKALINGNVTPAGIIGTTFTVKAATELRERVRDRLLKTGHLELAERSAESLIGTVHSVCERLLKRFAFELGLSPQMNVMSIEDGVRFFNQALDQELDLQRVRTMNTLSYRLGLVDRGVPEWQSTVKYIVEIARENDIGPDSLRCMGKSNADALLAFFGEPLGKDPTDELKGLVAAAAGMPKDGTKTTEAYRELLVEAKERLQHGDCPWRLWMRLATQQGAKKSSSHWAPVKRTAVLYERHPKFQKDLRTFTLGVFETAADCMGRFAQLKKNHGLIDFADMEQLMLRALDEEAVRKRLADEVELLLVDEFQDTNPMQLALFLKLAKLAKRVIFVGDVKQAIYKFRGCDPELVSDTRKGLADGKAGKDVLDRNWRSQESLLHYLNKLFAANFGNDPKQPVVLEARRGVLPGAAVTTWQLGAENLAERARLVARGVARLKADGEPVSDPKTDKERKVRYSDIAVLARTNDHVEQIAEALRERHLPMKMTLTGLLTTAEITLARSCLRRVADRADTLASAEIRALADGAKPEQWLEDRLRWLEEGNESIAWGEDDHPIIRRLGELRDESALRSPVEVVARVLNEVDIRRIVAAWGPDDIRAAQRQKNLDAFLDLAVEYEKHAASHHDPGTLTGFLLWLEHPSSPDLDLQPVVTSGDAVHVLTYHRAKGLEWPVVICTDFDYRETRVPVWDTRIELTGNFDIAAPLADRQLRYWPNVFGTRKSGLPALEAIVDSEEGQRCEEQRLDEQLRLAYVGMTRARDRLVLALPSKIAESGPGKGIWLQSFMQDFAVPAGNSGETTLPGGITIPTRVEIIDSEQDEPQDQREEYQPRWFERRARRRQTRRFVQPSSLPPVAAEVGQVIDFGERIPLLGSGMTDVDSGLHAVIAAEFVNPLSEREGIARAEKILVGHRMEGFVSGADALAAARRFRDFVTDHFAPSRIEVEVPIHHELGDGRAIRGLVDLLVETDAGWLAIDHESSPQRKPTWQDKALMHSGQLDANRKALEAAGRRVAACYIHFAVTGGMVEVKFG